MRPPPASASSGSDRDSHSHQPTGAAVANRPQAVSKTTVAGLDAPATSVTAIAAIATGMTAKVAYKPTFFRTKPMTVVPTKPAMPSASRISDSVDTWTRV